jgi:hypothetical protein
VKHFFERPLSTFVMLAILFALTQLYSSYLAFDDNECNFSGAVDGSTYAMIQGGVSLVLIFFAPYLQRAVWVAIMESVKTPPAEGEPPKYTDIEPKAKKDKKRPSAEQNLNPESPPEEEEVPMVNVDKAVVQAAFKKVFLEDLFVLFIFVVLCGNTGLSYACTAPGCEYPPSAYAIALPQASLISCAVYTFFYYCCACCANKVVIEKEEVDQAAAAPGLE